MGGNRRKLTTLVYLVECTYILLVFTRGLSSSHSHRIEPANLEVQNRWFNNFASIASLVLFARHFTVNFIAIYTWQLKKVSSAEVIASSIAVKFGNYIFYDPSQVQVLDGVGF